ncbi:MAG: PIG-L family deacetylase, partial [Acidimicrobiales bacterium]
MPQVGEVLAVCAQATTAPVLCFTHGEASSLGAASPSLDEIRAGEPAAAAAVLGVEEVKLLGCADGHLGEVPLEELAQRAEEANRPAEILVVFDEGDVTDYPDHCAATATALAARRRQLLVLAWAVPEQVARTLDAEHGRNVLGPRDAEVDLVITVDRRRQRQAIACHAGQSVDNPVLWRCPELSGASESLRWLRPLPGAEETPEHTGDDPGFDSGACGRRREAPPRPPGPVEGPAGGRRRAARAARSPVPLGLGRQPSPPS